MRFVRFVGSALVWFGLIIAFVLGLLVLVGWWGHLSGMTRSAPFELVAVDGERRLHVKCDGPSDAPFVLYDAGAFGIYTDGWWIQDELKSDFQVCLYDRAGMGWSDPAPEGTPPSPQFHIDDMLRLQSALGRDGPIYLIGHSMSGLRMHAFANLYQDRLAGLVFVDAANPQQFDIQRSERLIRLFSRAMSVGAMTARIGLAGGVAYVLPDELNLPKQPLSDKRRSIGSVRHHKAAKAEIRAALLGGDSFTGDGAANLPVAVYTNSTGGGRNGTVADVARERSGFGRLYVMPDETHVSFLNRTNAKSIAQDIRDMHAHRSSVGKADRSAQ